MCIRDRPRTGRRNHRPAGEGAPAPRLPGKSGPYSSTYEMCIRDRSWVASRSTAASRSSARSSPFRRCFGRSAAAAPKAAVSKPVSYTHLDVYKRQLLTRKSLLYGIQCGVAAAMRTEAVRSIFKMTFVNSFQYHSYYLLHQFVVERGYAESCLLYTSSFISPLPEYQSSIP